MPSQFSIGRIVADQNAQRHPRRRTGKRDTPSESETALQGQACKAGKMTNPIAIRHPAGKPWTV